MAARRPRRGLRPYENLTLDFVRCRLSHAGWENISGLFDPSRKRVIRTGQRVTWRCIGCGTERREVWTANGQLEERTYAYPEGYQIPGSGKDRMWQRKDYLRVEMMLRGEIKPTLPMEEIIIPSRPVRATKKEPTGKKSL